tara:strand:- start:14136 stop:15176 length:1041 start_codon:yes stop_codon:yes gene_type:complete
MIKIHVIDSVLRFPCLENKCELLGKNIELLEDYQELVTLIDNATTKLLFLWHMDVNNCHEIIKKVVQEAESPEKLIGVVLYKGGPFAFAKSAIDAQEQLRNLSVSTFAFPRAVPNSNYAPDDTGNLLMHQFVVALSHWKPDIPIPFQFLSNKYSYSRSAIAAIRAKDTILWSKNKITRLIPIEFLALENPSFKSIQHAVEKSDGIFGKIDSVIVIAHHALEKLHESVVSGNVEQTRHLWPDTDMFLNNVSAAISDIDQIMLDDLHDLGWNLEKIEFHEVKSALISEFINRNAAGELKHLTTALNEFQIKVNTIQIRDLWHSLKATDTLTTLNAVSTYDPREVHRRR